MGYTFTAIPESTFDELQLNAGVILKEFDPENPALVNANIVCATTGGLQIDAKPTYTDMGEDIDNCPKNMKELKHLDSWEVTMGFTALSITADVIKMALGAADKDTDSVTPRNSLEQTDFADSVWWVGDMANGDFVAVEIKNALSTDGLSIKTTDKGKGQFGVTITGHYSIDAQDTVPVKYYLGKISA